MVLCPSGIEVINGLGIKYSVHWGTITILCTIPAILTILAVIFMPESPFYVVGKNRDNEALKSLIWLRGSTFDVKDFITRNNINNHSVG